MTVAPAFQGDQGQRGIRGLTGPPGVTGPSGPKVRASPATLGCSDIDVVKCFDWNVAPLSPLTIAREKLVPRAGWAYLVRQAGSSQGPRRVFVKCSLNSVSCIKVLVRLNFFFHVIQASAAVDFQHIQ